MSRTTISCHAILSRGVSILNPSWRAGPLAILSQELRAPGTRAVLLLSQRAHPTNWGNMRNFTRRELLKLGATTAAAELASLALQGCGGGSISFPSVPSVPAACSKLTDIEHVVILIQENRSFDHYFGSYRGVRGFSDQSAAFQQPDPSNTTNSPIGSLLPFH
jgi:hypothetical protein